MGSVSIEVSGLGFVRTSGDNQIIFYRFFFNLVISNTRLF